MKRLFIYSRPENHTLKGVDEQWPLSISLRETAGFSSRSFIAVFSILVIIFILFPPYEAAAKDKKKDVILSTVDIDGDYEILGLVYYRSNELSPKKIHDALQKKAKEMGADCVIGITYYSNAGYLYASGTAVKFIEEEQ